MPLDDDGGRCCPSSLFSDLFTTRESITEKIKLDLEMKRIISLLKHSSILSKTDASITDEAKPAPIFPAPKLTRAIMP
jgi:hypothetical protein